MTLPFDPTGYPGNPPPGPIDCATAPSSYMNLPPMRPGLVKWAKTVDLTNVERVMITLTKKGVQGA
jgi:hypothetical protein